MKRVSLVRMLSLLLCAALGFGMAVTVLPTRAEAATTTHQLKTLLAEGKIKALGRTQVNAAGTGITANWSANGFEINVKSNGGKFTVGYDTNSNNYTAVLVDDTLAWRGLTTGKGTVSVELTAGTHKVSVMRENGHASAAASYLHYTTVAFDGTVEAKPADKNLFIEVIGDSYACGSGSAEGVEYAPGVQWGDLDHSGRASFGWYLSQMLNADLSIVARGGIGLNGKADDAQEEVDNSANMIGIYPSASGHNTAEGEYDFANARKPDLVVIELGANDGVDADLSEMTAWKAQMETMIALVREKYGAGTKILLLSHKAVNHGINLQISDEDDKIWACHFSHHGNGAAALKSQKEGHPSAGDEYEIAEALLKSIQDWDILGAPVEAEPTYNDIVYYVSENGSDSNDGKTLATAKATLYEAMLQARTDNGSAKFPKGTRVVVKVEGTVKNRASNSDTLGDGQIYTETGTALKDNKHIPVLVTTNDYSGTRAVVLVEYGANSNANARLRVVNDFQLKDITIQSVTNSNGYCTHNFFAAGCHVSFDNTLLTTDGKAGTKDGEDNNKWTVSASHITDGGMNPTKTEWLPMYGTITFKNGDYTNLNFASAVSIDKLTTGTVELPQVHTKLVIEDGAKMGTVYGAYGTLGVETVTVELRGGTVERYYATKSGTSSKKLTYNTDITTIFAGTQIAEGYRLKGTGDYVTLNGNVNVRFEGGALRNTGANMGFCGTGSYATINGDVTVDFVKGQFIGELYAAVGNNTTVNGNVTNNISGGEIRIEPVGDNGKQGVYLAGFDLATIQKVAGKESTTGNVTNNISGGDINILYRQNEDCGIHLGLRNGTIHGNLINNVSGGNLCTMQTVGAVSAAGIFFGSYDGDVLGSLTNNITGGVFSQGTTKIALSLGNRTVHNIIGRLDTTIGIPGSDRGPRFYHGVSVGGGRAYVGGYIGTKPSDKANANHCPEGWTLDITGKPLPVPTYVSDKTLVETTVYSGYFASDFTASPSSANDYGKDGNGNVKHYYGYVRGNVATNVYGGKFCGSFYGAGANSVLGHVTTNIYGGSFCNIYGAADGAVYNGVELNIYGMTDYTTVYNKSGDTYTVPTYKIHAGGTMGKVFTQDASKPAVQLTIAPTRNSDVRLYRTIISAGFNSTSGQVLFGGTTVATVKGGIYPNGFKFTGKTVGEVLASGYEFISHISGSKLSYAATDTEVVGYAEVVPAGQGSSRELVYYVRPNGSDSNDGLTFVKAKKTLNGAFNQAVADNGGSTEFPNGSKLTIYVDGTINAHPDGTQAVGYNKLLTTADGSHMETVIATYNYSATNTRATVNMNTKPTNPGNASCYLVTDLTFKDVTLLSKAYYHDDKDDDKKDGWFATNKLYAAGCNLTFDNARIITDGNSPTCRKWIIGADHFGKGGNNPLLGNPVNGVVTFKNGDYTELDYVTTVQAPSIWVATNDTRVEMPNITGKIIIEEGAIMDDVYGPVGAMKVGGSTVEVRGGYVNELNGTGHGDKKLSVDSNIIVSGGNVGTLNCTGNGAKVNLTGDVNISMSGGTVDTFNGTGTEATVNGDVNIAVSGGNVGSFVAIQSGGKVNAVNSTFSGGVIGSYVGTASGAKNALITATGDISTTVSGATVNLYTGSGNYVTLTGDVTNTLSAGLITGKRYSGLGNFVTFTGDLTNNISGGKLEILPVTKGNSEDGIWFSGRNNMTITGNVENNISAGEIGMHFTAMTTDNNGATVGVAAGIWGGTRGSTTNVITGNLTNNISGGRFYAFADEGITMGSRNFYGGCFEGGVSGTLTNNITGGIFEEGLGSFTFTSQGIGTFAYRIVNTLGKPDGTGPQFLSAGALNFGGGWGENGVTSLKKAYPSKNSDAVVLSTTIYGGTYSGNCYFAQNTEASTSNNRYTYIAGSIKTEIHGGTFQKGFFYFGKANVYGNVFVDIYGGTFDTMNFSSNAGSVQNSGSKRLTIHGGSFPKGMTLTGVTITNALAPNRGLIEDSSGIVLEPADYATDKQSGTNAVTVKPVDLSLRFTGASVTLYNDLSVGFKADGAPFSAENGYTEPYAEFRCGGVVTKVTDYKLDNGRLVFQFSNIAPHRIGDTITATVYATKDGVLYAGKPVRYSVKDYCYNMLVKQAGNEKLAKLLVDLLNYGAAAQNYAGHNTDALVNNGLSEAQKAMGTQAMPTVSSEAKDTVNTLEGATVAWKGAGLYLEDAVTVRLTLEAESLEGLTFRFLADGKTATMEADELVAIEGTTNQYYLYFDMLNAAQMRVPLQVVALRDGEAVSDTVQYSIECYVANKHGAADSTEQLNALLDAMIRYGDAAENYVK